MIAMADAAPSNNQNCSSAYAPLDPPDSDSWMEGEREGGKKERVRVSE